MKELELSKGLKPFESWLQTRIKRMEKPNLLTPEGGTGMKE
jgi:hypothetical protein